jgi:methyl-accepting chemotaxis protein
MVAARIKDVAVIGSSEVKGMIGAMVEINQSSRDISTIVQTIDELAYQANRLAFDAAVEAALSGAGEGISDVALKLRELADRSARAAKETAELLDQSSRRAEKGAQIADGTAVAFSEIVEEISRLSVLVGEIASSSSDPAVGNERPGRGPDLPGSEGGSAPKRKPRSTGSRYRAPFPLPAGAPQVCPGQSV